MRQAWVRLGEAPMEELFVRVAVPLATAGTPGAWLGRWRLMAIDGVMLDIAFGVLVRSMGFHRDRP